VHITQARRLYAHNQHVPWPDINLSSRRHLKSQRVPVSLLSRSRAERIAEIRRRRALLSVELRRDPAYAIGSTNWDTFSSWEWDAVRWAGYLGDRDWDHSRVLVASSSDEAAHVEDKEDDKDNDEYEDGVKPVVAPVHVPGEVLGELVRGKVVRDNTGRCMGFAAATRPGVAVAAAVPFH
jgi:hypothetical protein